MHGIFINEGLVILIIFFLLCEYAKILISYLFLKINV